MALCTSRELPLVYSWSLPEVSAVPNIRQWLDPCLLAQGGTSHFLFPDRCPKWAQCPISDDDLTSTYWPEAERETLSKTDFRSKWDGICTRNVTCKFPFSSGVPIGYCLCNCLVIGLFKCFQNLQVNLGNWGFTWSWPGVMWFHLCLVARLVTSLVILLTF